MKPKISIAKNIEIRKRKINLNLIPYSKISFKQLRRSIFGKYFITCTSVILISFLGLAAVLIILSVQYSNRQKQIIYQKSAENIAKYVLDISGTIAAQRQLQGLINIIIPTIGADGIYIVETTGIVDVGWSNFSGDIIDANKPIPPEVMNALKVSKNYDSVGTMEGYYTKQYLIEGVPIISSDNKVIGAVIVTSRADNLTDYLKNIFRIFIISLVIVLIFAFVALYFITLRLVKPLRQMSNAAKSFAKGDFSNRVPVYNNDEVGQLAVAFNNMASSLTSLEEMRRNFVANVSHELKSPMTSIAGFIDGILDGTIPNENQEYYLKIVSEEVKRLSRLVRSFLDIARIEAGELKINPSQFDIEETIRRVIVGFEIAINEKNLTVKGLEDADKQLKVVADADFTHQIIYNLVDNAVKFASVGGYIEINVVTRDKKVFVGVKNSGMGIPSSDIPFVFDRFYKTDKSRSTDRKGVGLGLYIVKSILNKQGEDIVVKSVEGESCEFVFTLQRV